MIIKSYTAPTVAAALKKIREEMGGSAVVLNTKVNNDADGGILDERVEVTACIDDKAADFRKLKLHDDVDDPAMPEEDVEAVATLTEEKAVIKDTSALNRIDKTLGNILNENRYAKISDRIGEEAKYIFLNLLNADLPEEIAARICEPLSEVDSATQNIESKAFDIIINELQPLCTPSIRLQPGAKVAFVGPSGSGKSSVMAKFAAQITMQSHLKVKLTSLENISDKKSDNDAVEIFASPLSNEIKSQINTDDGSILLIDTPSITPNDPNTGLLDKLNKFEPNVLFFVFSVGNRTCDLIDSINTYECFTPTYLIATHLDETERWGGIMAMAEYLNRPVAFVTNSSGKIGRLYTADSAVIADRLLKTGGCE
jgi:flagellar biosynthesis protein FlhF